MAIQAKHFLIPFGRSGMTAQQNRWLARSEDLALAENVSFESDLVQKEQAVKFYDTTGVLMQVFGGNWNLAGVKIVSDFAACAVAYEATVAIPVATQLQALGAAAQASPWQVPVNVGCPSGGMIIVQFAGEGGGQALTSLTDTKGHVYRRDVSSTGSPSIEQWSAVNTFGLVGGGVDHWVFTYAVPDDVMMTAVAYTNMGPPAFPVILVNRTVTQDLAANDTVSLQFDYLTHFPLLLVGGAICKEGLAVTGFTWNVAIVEQAVAVIAGDAQLRQASRFLSRSPSILAQVEWRADAQSAPVGTVKVDNDSTLVTGVLTTFLTTFRYGDKIVVGGETQYVKSISSNLLLDTISPWITSRPAGTAYLRQSGPTIITASLFDSAAVTGGLYKETPTSDDAGALRATVLTPSLTNSERRGKFVIGGKEAAANPRRLFYLNGADPIQVLTADGAATANIPTPAADWGVVRDPQRQPINAVVHQDSLMVWGNLNDPHRLYISSTTDHRDFTPAPAGTAIQMRIASQIGDRLWGGLSFKGVLYLWKHPRGLFYLDDSSIDRYMWGYRTVSATIGCAPSPHSVLSVDDDVIFCDPDGHFHMLSAAQTAGGQSSSDLTRLLGLQFWTQENIRVETLGQMYSAYCPETKIAYFGVQSRDALTDDNDLLLKFDFALVGRGGPVRFSYSTCFHPNSILFKRGVTYQMPRMFLGEETTSYLAVASGTQTTRHGYRTEHADGVNTTTLAYSFDLRTPEMDLVEADPANRIRRKSFDRIELTAKEPSFSEQIPEQPISIEIWVDGMLRETLTIPALGFTAAPKNRRRWSSGLSCGDGYELQLRIKQVAAIDPNDVTRDLPLLGACIWWSPLGQDQSRVS